MWHMWSCAVAHPRRPCGTCRVCIHRSSHRCIPPAPAHTVHSHIRSVHRTPLLAALQMHHMDLRDRFRKCEWVNNDNQSLNHNFSYFFKEYICTHFLVLRNLHTGAACCRGSEVESHIQGCIQWLGQQPKHPDHTADGGHQTDGYYT